MYKKSQAKLLLTLTICFLILPISFALSQTNGTDVEVYYYSDENLSVSLNVYSDGNPIRGKGTVYVKFITPKDYTLEHFSVKSMQRVYLESNPVNLVSEDADAKIYKGQWDFSTTEQISDKASITLNGSNYIPKVGNDIYIDTIPPKLKSMRVVSSTKIEVFFDEFWMDGQSVNDATYYSISPSLAINDILAGGAFARIFTDFQVNDLKYTVTLANNIVGFGGIKDAAGNKFVDINNTLSFTGTSVANEDPHGYYSKNTFLCAVCHSTHKSQGQAILTQDQVLVCFLCHDSAGQSKYDVKGEFGTSQTVVSKHPLSIITESSQSTAYSDRFLCSDCHDVHGNRTEVTSKLLRSYQHNNGEKVKQLETNEYCWSCHGDTTFRNSKIKGLFPDIKDLESIYTYGHIDIYLNSNASPTNNYKNDCLFCHKGHSSSNLKILRNRFTVPTSSDYGLENFNLCFDCHNETNRAALTDPIPNIKKYYDGSSGVGHVIKNNNLGFQDEQGNPLPVGWKIPCTDCHAPHGNSFQNEKMLNDDLSQRIGNITGLWNSEDVDKQRAACFACHKPSDEDGMSGRSYRGGTIPKLQDLTVDGYIYQHANNQNKPLNPLNCLTSNCHGQNGATAHNPVPNPQ